MKPVAAALGDSGVRPRLVFTGQHPQLNAREFDLGGYPRLELGQPGREDPHTHVGAVTKALLPLLLRSPPDLLLVQGDTSSAMGGALAAFMAGVPVGHVEAGLRTPDPLLPWPEEEYRTAIDARADLLFAPTELSAENLRGERLPGEIHVTGNTAIDAVVAAEARLPAPSLREGRAPRILHTCHRHKSWTDGHESIAEAVKEIAGEGTAEVDLILHPNPFVAGRITALLGDTRGVNLLAPCSHDELLQRMRGSDLVLSDGIQEEAPALGVPLLVLREKTERPEALAAGAARLVGTDPTRIVGEVRELLADPAALAAMSRRVFPFGDGSAGRRIAAIVTDWVELRSLTRRLA